MEPLKVGYILLHNSLAKDYLNGTDFFLPLLNPDHQIPRKMLKVSGLQH